ncbi:ArnT family glycosyltransferase [Catenulispora rubra]|uniref:ArnT family glycosyltransferase n=1 Tax=Catenulispora rubra TaxID=280293 RepID=UPI0018926A4E|nr:glucosyltransferase domain-containing protein [Catenulispora rubra]
MTAVADSESPESEREAGAPPRRPIPAAPQLDETTLIPMVVRPTVRQEHRPQPAPPTERRAVLAVAAVATMLSVGAYVYFSRRHLVLALKDSYSHLEIGRRVVTGPTPGIAQLGGVWLPLPHVLQMPFAWNSTLYTSGLSGSLVSMGCFVAAAVLIYRTVRIFSPDRVWPGIIAASVFMANPNVLYLQSTAMDEMPFYACTLAAVYFLVRWADTGRPTGLLAAGLASMAAMLCRYEAWFLACVYVLCVALISRKLGYRGRDARGLALIPTVFGLLSAASGWVFYNWAIFGSPLNFLTGEGSSAQQMAHRTDPEIGSITTTLHAYGIAVTANLGMVMVAVAIAALGAFLLHERLSARSLPITGLLLLPAFHIASIERGQFPIGVPQINGDLDNLRFGLAPILPAALLIGCLAARWPRRWPALPVTVTAVVLIAALSTTTFARNEVVIAAEARNANTYLELQAQTADVLVHQTGGPILMNGYGNEKVLFPVLQRTIYEGSKTKTTNLWLNDLKDPAENGIQVVVMRFTGPTPDDVYHALYKSPILADRYRLSFQNGQYLVYVRK